MSMYELCWQMMRAQAAASKLTRQQMLERGGEVVHREFDKRGREVCTFRFGPKKDILLSATFENDRVQGTDITFDNPDDANASAVKLPGSDDVVLARKEALTRGRLAGVDAQVVKPCRLPDGSWWIVRTAESLAQGHWHRDVRSSESIRDLLRQGKVVRIELGPYDSGAEAMKDWAKPGDKQASTPQKKGANG